MTRLVTGATGFIGSRVLRAGDRRLVRSNPSDEHAFIGDLLDVESLNKACEGVGSVFHCAGFAHAFVASDPLAHWRVNFEGTRNLVEAAGRAGVKNFVFLSSVKAMADPSTHCIDEDWPGEPNTPYGKAKRAAEESVLQAGVKFGMHVVNLRLSMVYGKGGRGNLERMLRAIQTGWFPPIPETGNRRSIVHVDDVVAAIELVSTHERANGRTYILSNPQSYSGKAIYDAIRYALLQRRIACRRLVPFDIPANVFRAAGLVGDLVGFLRARPLGFNSEVVTRLLESACYSSARIESELGWRARISLDDGLLELLKNETFT